MTSCRKLATGSIRSQRTGLQRKCPYHKFEGGSELFYDMDSYADAHAELAHLLGRRPTDQDHWERSLICTRDYHLDEGKGCNWERLHKNTTLEDYIRRQGINMQWL